MKKIFFMLLVSLGAFAQDQVFNVQKYCIDEKPFKANSCDISGTEYSFVFMNAQKKEVTLFLVDNKLKYTIVSATTTPVCTTYILENPQGQAEMRIYKSRRKMEFLYPDKQIMLTVGTSTKLE